jgi:hypothetical protein
VCSFLGGLSAGYRVLKVIGLTFLTKPFRMNFEQVEKKIVALKSLRNGAIGDEDTLPLINS